MKSLIVLLLLAVAVLAQTSTSRGVATGPSSPGVAFSNAMVAGWFDAKPLKISAESGDVVVATKYPHMVLFGFINQDPTNSATLKVKTSNGNDTAFVIPLSGGEKLWPLPEIKTIVKTGTSDSLIVLFQYLN